MDLQNFNFKADCIRIAEMCYHRLEVRPLSEKDRQIFFDFLVTYFPAVFPNEEPHRNAISYKLASKLCRVILDYAEYTDWPEGFIQSFWLDVISRPFLEDVTQEYIDVRRELWHRLFETSLSQCRDRGSCF